MAARHREFAERLAERQSLTMPAEDPNFEDLGPAFPAWAELGRNAVLLPPKPQIQPSGWVLELITGRDVHMEAAD
jgi:hypothetical protein